jgi:valyl-tRNA synthetase
VEAPVFVENAAAGAGPGAMAVAQGIEMFMPLAGVIDLAAEAVRLKKERQKAEEQARQAEVKLANPEFVARAKEEVIQEMTSRLTDARALIDKLDRALGNISA